jgi:aryl-alcohol dehydrogenase-like predicted oxidoreductase
MIRGHATTEGTARFRSRFPDQDKAGFYRQAQGLHVSSLGLGTYLGAMDEATDRSYAEAITAALRGGINFLDTAINYRLQRSERAIGGVLADAVGRGELQRDEVVVCTKAGFLVPEAVPKEVLQPGDTIGNVHSMAPAFLADQVERSLGNLGLETVDVLYLHNPEMQLQAVPRGEFDRRVRMAFGCLERLVASGKMRLYGVATWHGLRRAPGARDALSLARLAELAELEGGGDHHFRFIQLPFNLGMAEAFGQRPEQLNGKPASILEAAAALGVTVVASASLLQARLAADLSQEIADAFPGTSSDAQRAIQFARSAPGVAVALAGMSQAAHVRENLGVSAVPALPPDDYAKLFRPVA